MPDIKRILVPVNGTEESTKALKLANTLAQIYNAEIALLLVTYFNEGTDDNANEDSWLATPVAQYSHNVLDNARRYLSAKLQISTHNLSGQPKFKILEFAQIYSADIIIMGCRNLSFFDSILKGSVSRYILEKSTCPVIIVK